MSVSHCLTCIDRLIAQAKVKYIGQLSHPRLVKIIGYCLEDEQRLLVYEYMSRGSLDNHLFRSKPMNFSPMLLKFIAYLNKSNIIQKPQNQKKCKKTFLVLAIN